MFVVKIGRDRIRSHQYYFGLLTKNTTANENAGNGDNDDDLWPEISRMDG